jgi:hypothetical protein
MANRLASSLQIQNIIVLYNEHMAHMPDEFKKSARLEASLPAFCYARDKLNLSKRLLRHEFVEVMAPLSVVCLNSACLKLKPLWANS